MAITKMPTTTIAILVGLASLLGAIASVLLALRLLRGQGRPVQHPAPAAKSAPTDALGRRPTWRLPRPTRQLPYARTITLLSPAEQSFLGALRSAAPPGLVIFPQVRLAGLVHTTERNERRRRYDFYRIQAKTVDFVLCDAQTTAPMLVVELDDASHDRADRRQRDAFVDEVLASVGLPILHVRWSRSYDPETLARAIAERLGVQPQPAAPALPPAPAHVAPALPPLATPIVLAADTPIQHAPPQPGGAPLLVTQQVVEAQPRATQMVCGSCRAPLSQHSKYCAACGAALG